MSGALVGRRVLITGAANGIGLASLTRCLTEGATVVALDRDEKALAELCRRFAGAAIHVVAADVAEPASVAEAVAAAAKACGGLDGVVNSAGIDLVADIETMTAAEWNSVLAV